MPLLLVLVVVLLISVLAAVQFGGRQPITTSLDIGFSVLRFFMPLIVVFLVQDLVFREFDRKLYLFTLSYPVSRVRWLLSRFFVLLVVVASMMLFGAFLLALAVGFASSFLPSGTPVNLGLLYWTAIAFFMVDLFVVVAVAFFVSVIASTSSFLFLGVLGFVLVSRSYASIVALLMKDSSLVLYGDEYRSGVGALGYLFPNLGGLDVRMISIYGKFDFFPDDWVYLVMSALVYGFVFLMLAVWAFQRKVLS